MDKIIAFDARKTMTKKAWRALQAEKRSVNGFNTGTRTHKSPRDYDRKKNKNLEKSINN